MAAFYQNAEGPGKEWGQRAPYPRGHRGPGAGVVVWYLFENIEFYG